MRKTALITGASKRIGRAIAEHLAAHGWNIIIHFNQSEKPADEFVQYLKAIFPGQQFEKVHADLKNIEEVLIMIPNIVQKFGSFQLLVNNASVFNSGFLKETTPGLFENQMNINVKAPFFLMREFAIHCKTGNIINMTDTRITTSKSDFAAYSLSKKGLWEITQMAALEFAPDIRVNAIAPGVTLTPEDHDEEYLKGLAKNIPMKKPGGIEPILKSIDYILKNEYLTGQLLFADGGENLGKKTY